jgi:hypothetical protein
VSRLDEALAAPRALPPDMAARVRAQLTLEASRTTSSPSWRRDIVRAWASAIGLSAVVALALSLSGQLDVDAIAHRWPGIAMLVLSSAVCAWAALVPRKKWARPLAMATASLTAISLVALRMGHGEASALPEWVCSVGHVTAALPPVVLAALTLRRLAPSRSRALTLGLSMGTIGALMGELACSQSAGHVVLFHLTAWAIVATSVWVVSSKMQPRSYAP